MKTKSKTLSPRVVPKLARESRPAKTNRASAGTRPVVPLNERRLHFGNKWDYAPAPETSEYIKIAPRHELFIDGQFA